MTLPTITATGRLGADPELKFTPSGHAVANFRIACDDRKFNKQTNEWETAGTIWLGVEQWRDQAEAAAEHLSKGDLVTVIGELNVREFEHNGVTRQAVEVKNARVTKALPRTNKPSAGGPIQRAESNPWDAQQQPSGGASWETPPF